MHVLASPCAVSRHGRCSCYFYRCCGQAPPLLARVGEGHLSVLGVGQHRQGATGRDGAKVSEVGKKGVEAGLMTSSGSLVPYTAAQPTPPLLVCVFLPLAFSVVLSEWLCC